MDQVPSKARPLSERVGIAHRYVSQLIDEASYDPPTPGVTEDLRRTLANEIDRGAEALARTAQGRAEESIVSELERHQREARSLAEALSTEHGEPVGKLRGRLGAHLDAERDLAARVADDAGRSAGSWAEEYSRHRDQLVYGL